MKKLSFIAIFWLLCGALHAQDCNLNSTAQKHWDNAEKLIKLNPKTEDYYKVVDEFNKAAKYAPSCPKIYLLLSKCQEKLCKLNSQYCDSAKNNFTKYLKLDPISLDKKEAENQLYEIESKKEFSSQGYNQKGVQAFNERNYEKAIEYFTESIRLNPSAVTYVNIGNSYVHIKNDYDHLITAIAYYEKAIELDPKYDEAYFQLANANFSLGNNNVGLLYYKKYATFESNAKTCYNLGIESRKINNIELAVAYFDRAVDIDYSFADAYWQLARSYGRLAYYNNNNITYLNNSIINYNIAADYYKRKDRSYCYYNIASTYYYELKDKIRARSYWEKSAKCGYGKARGALRKLRGELYWPEQVGAIVPIFGYKRLNLRNNSYDVGTFEVTLHNHFNMMDFTASFQMGKDYMSIDAVPLIGWLLFPMAKRSHSSNEKYARLAVAICMFSSTTFNIHCGNYFTIRPYWSLLRVSRLGDENGKGKFNINGALGSHFSIEFNRFMINPYIEWTFGYAKKSPFMGYAYGVSLGFKLYNG